MGAAGRNSRCRGERGFTLLETLVAVAIFGLVGPAFLLGLSTAFRATQVSDEQIQAEALARSQLETIEAAPYLDCSPTPCYQLITSLPAQYAISLDVQILDSSTCVADGNCNTLQQITVSVTRSTGDGGSRPVRTISAFKVRR